MARRLRPSDAIGALAVALAATAITVAMVTGSTDASTGGTVAGVAVPGTHDLMAPATGEIGGVPIRVRVLAPHGADGRTGTTVTVVASTTAPVTGMRITDPGDAVLPVMTGALLVSRATGEIDAPTSTTHGHGHSQGQGLGAALGATGVFAAKVSPGATTVDVDSQGTRLVATYPEAGAIETVDLVRATRPVRSLAVQRPTAVWFAPAADGVWVNDADAGVRVVNDAGRASEVIGGAPGRNTVAFAPGLGLAAIAGEGSNEAVLVRTADHARSATLELPAPATSVTFLRSPPAIAVTHADGSLSVAPLNRAGARPFRLATGIPGGPGTTAAITPDGTRVTLLLPDSRRLAVLDLTRRRLLTTVDTGADPTGLVLLNRRFAVTRSRSQATATWVDVRTPSRAADIPLGDRPAASMTLTDGGTRLLLTDPSARQVLDVHAMMGRPMVMGVIPGTFAPDEVVAFPGGMRRTGPREYRRSVVLRDDGAHRITVSSPGDSFSAVLPGARAASPTRASVTSVPAQGRAGQGVPITLRITGAPPDAVEVLMVSSGRSGVHQVRARARRHGSREWTAAPRPTAAGRYTVFAVVNGVTADGAAAAPAVIDVTP